MTMQYLRPEFEKFLPIPTLQDICMRVEQPLEVIIKADKLPKTENLRAYSETDAWKRLTESPALVRKLFLTATAEPAGAAPQTPPGPPPGWAPDADTYKDPLAVVVSQMTTFVNAVMDAWTLFVNNITLPDTPDLTAAVEVCYYKIEKVRTRLEEREPDLDIPHIQSLRVLMCGELEDPDPEAIPEGVNWDLSRFMPRPLGSQEEAWNRIFHWLDTVHKRGVPHPFAHVLQEAREKLISILLELEIEDIVRREKRSGSGQGPGGRRPKRVRSPGSFLP